MHKPRPKRPRLIAALALALAVLAAGGASWWWLSRGNNAAKWITAKASRGDIEDTTTALGTLQPLEYVDVGTQVSGQLRRIFVQVGDQVTQGQPLAEIDPTVYGSKVEAGQANLQNLQAQLTEKQAQAALAEELFGRQQRMLAANATSQEAFQNAQTTLKAAKAQVAQLQAQIVQVQSTLKGDQANLGYTKIYAPMTGTVVSQAARQGQTLVASQQAPTIVRIADLSTMSVWTQVSEADVGKLKLGQPVYFTTLGNPERKRTSTLRQILPTPEVLNNVVLYDALFDVPNPQGDLGIQMSAQVFFVHASAENAILVPVSALNQTQGKGKGAGKRDKGQGGDTVLVMQDGVPQPRAVTVGVRNRVQAQVVSGLEEGEEVVVGQRLAEAGKAPPSQGQRGAVPPPPR
ncbi:MAG: efflux RND transporter periplasmic adaptor subunit [Magnetospirillum sp.]|nr:efflux RND transporter periplasmic adaptor subunit [Magnetospirillum sp.]